MEWKEERFKSVPHCNTYSLHRVSGNSVFCVTLSGKVYWMNDQKPIDLRKLFDENSSEEDNLEIVASDCAEYNNTGILAFLVTCWVLFDEYWMPKRYFAAIFKASSDCTFDLSYKLELDNVPSYTRVTAEAAIACNRHCWLIFTASRAARLFVIQPTTLAVEEVESVGDIYPGLDLGDLPGSAIRSYCLQTSTYRWSVLGFDTGYVIATTLSLKTNFIENRSKLKFSGAISVLLILQHIGREDNISVLVSSTLGPAAIWTLSLAPDKSHFEWKRVSVLEDTRGHDAIVCSASGENLIAIGTYGGGKNLMLVASITNKGSEHVTIEKLSFNISIYFDNLISCIDAAARSQLVICPLVFEVTVILIYKRMDLICGDNLIAPCSIFEIYVPVISMIFLQDDLLTVLTTSGLHVVVCQSKETTHI